MSWEPSHASHKCSLLELLLNSVVTVSIYTSVSARRDQGCLQPEQHLNSLHYQTVSVEPQNLLVLPWFQVEPGKEETLESLSILRKGTEIKTPTKINVNTQMNQKAQICSLG